MNQSRLQHGEEQQKQGAKPQGKQNTLSVAGKLFTSRPAYPHNGKKSKYADQDEQITAENGIKTDTPHKIEFCNRLLLYRGLVNLTYIIPAIPLFPDPAPSDRIIPNLFYSLIPLSLVREEYRPSKKSITKAVDSVVDQIGQLPALRHRSFKTILPCSHAAKARCLMRDVDPYRVWLELSNASEEEKE